MSIYALVSLNTVITIKEDIDYDEDYDIFEELHSKYVLKSRNLADSYNLETEVSFSDDNLNLIIHNKLGKNTLVFSSGETHDFPIIPDDETFSERCQEFIKDLAAIYPEVSDFNIPEAKKRIFTFS